MTPQEQSPDLVSTAESLARLLAARQVRVVFAESCTAGLVSATLSHTAGISDWLCGSAVTYREATKQDWLSVSDDDLQRYTAVSKHVARQMAMGVLETTREADFAASVTGHLGPGAPASLDGVVFVAIARRQEGATSLDGVWRFQLEAIDRVARQQEAAVLVLRRVYETIQER